MTNSLTYPFLKFIQHFQLAAKNTSQDTATVFHARPHGRFIELQSNLRRKSLTNQGSDMEVVLSTEII